ncbi:methyltransferase domain-containing protein [candidate division KSB1 bacterium]
MKTGITITKGEFSGQSISRFDFLMKHYKSGNILDVGNIGGVYGGDASDSFHVTFSKTVPVTDTVYGFDLYKPKDSDKYKNQKQGDVQEGLPYEDHFFDTVYLGELIEHLDNPGLALSEVARVLKEDGVFILDTPNPYNFKRILKFVLFRKEDLGDPTHIIFFTPASLKALLKIHGFNITFLAEKNAGFMRFLPYFITRGLGDNLLVVAKVDRSNV